MRDLLDNPELPQQPGISPEIQPIPPLQIPTQAPVPEINPGKEPEIQPTKEPEIPKKLPDTPKYK